MLLDSSKAALFSQEAACQRHQEGFYDYLDLLIVPRIRRQTPMLPQRLASTDLLFVGLDDVTEDTTRTLIYKPDDHRTSSSGARAATPASASTIPHSADSVSSSSFNSDSGDAPEE